MDVVVVGSGPSGGVVAHTLATRGFRVVCLEQGDWVSPADYPANYPEWELLIQKQWAHDPNKRRLPADYPLEVSDSDMWPVMFNAVGGSSIYYGAEWPRLLPSDFAVRTLDGVGDDWPITYADLAPYNDRIDAFIGVSGLGGDPAYPEGLDYPLPPHPLGKAGRKAAAGMNALGWHWWPGTNAIPSQKFKELVRSAPAGGRASGAARKARRRPPTSHLWPHALRSGATLVTGARVRKIETGRDGRATGAVWIDRAGGEHRQRAHAVVVCANGIGTPRLLLLSASAQHRDGLANSSGLVGKNLMLHPNCSVTGFYDEDLESWRGPAGQLIHSMEFYDTRAEHDFVRGAKLHALPTPGPLNAVEAHRALPYDQLWGTAIHDVARSHARGILWAANTEDLPDEANTVTLDPDLTDDDGVRRPRSATASATTPVRSCASPCSGWRRYTRPPAQPRPSRSSCGSTSPVICWARPGWATIPAHRSSTPTAGHMTCRTCSWPTAASSSPAARPTRRAPSPRSRCGSRSTSQPPRMARR